MRVINKIAPPGAVKSVSLYPDEVRVTYYPNGKKNAEVAVFRRIGEKVEEDNDAVIR